MGWDADTAWKHRAARRATADVIVLLVAGNRLLDGKLAGDSVLLVLGALVPFTIAGLFVDLHARVAVAALVLLGYGLLISKFLFSEGERTLIWDMKDLTDPILAKEWIGTTHAT